MSDLGEAQERLMFYVCDGSGGGDDGGGGGDGGSSNSSAKSNACCCLSLFLYIYLYILYSITVLTPSDHRPIRADTT